MLGGTYLNCLYWMYWSNVRSLWDKIYLPTVSPSPKCLFLPPPKSVLTLDKFSLIWFFNLCKLKNRYFSEHRMLKIRAGIVNWSWSHFLLFCGSIGVYLIFLTLPLNEITWLINETPGYSTAWLVKFKSHQTKTGQNSRFNSVSYDNKLTFFLLWLMFVD